MILSWHGAYDCNIDIDNELPEFAISEMIDDSCACRVSFYDIANQCLIKKSLYNIYTDDEQLNYDYTSYVLETFDDDHILNDWDEYGFTPEDLARARAEEYEYRISNPIFKGIYLGNNFVIAWTNKCMKVYGSNGVMTSSIRIDGIDAIGSLPNDEILIIRRLNVLIFNVADMRLVKN